MSGLLLALLILQVNPTPTGVATGVVLGPDGMPTANVRVYAVRAGDANTVTTDTAAYESLAQTDAAGRYQIEVPAGRYYIAAGSVVFPTYYPNTPLIAAAKVITIAAGTTVESVNLSRYVPATPGGDSFAYFPPGSTGALSGIVRSFDGRPAYGISVIISPIKPRSLIGGTRAVTDKMGRYRIENVTPDTYNVVAGYPDSAVVLPNTITTTPATMMDALNFTLPATSITTIRGRVLALAGRPAGGARLLLTNIDPTPSGVAALLPRRYYNEVASTGDGSYEITDVVAGTYALRAEIAGTTAISQTIVVAGLPAGVPAGLPMEVDFSLPVDVVVGRIVWDDGTPVSEVAHLEVAVSAASSPGDMEQVLLPVSGSGVFSGFVEAGDYRFHFIDLPAEYAIQSITSGTTDLLKDSLHVRSDAPTDIDVHISRRHITAPRITGKVIDAVTGAPSTAERMSLCCFDSGPFHQLSAGLRPDGSFEFPEVPESSYTFALQGTPALQLLDPSIDVGGPNISGRVLVSAAEFVPVIVTFSVDANGASLPDSMATVTLTSPNETFHVTTLTDINRELRLYLPAGIRYLVSLTDLPASYKVQSIDQSPASPPRVVIALTRQ